MLVEKFVEDGYFGIRDVESGDCQTYESEDKRDKDFAKIVDEDSLCEVFEYET